MHHGADEANKVTVPLHSETNKKVTAPLHSEANKKGTAPLHSKANKKVHDMSNGIKVDSNKRHQKIK